MRYILIVAVVFATFGVQAQTSKFGDISRQELEFEVYKKDSTASALVIFSVGSSHLDFISNKFRLTVEKHVRIKILTDEGLDEGDITIPFRNRDSNSPQKIGKLKAQSYFIGDNGRLVKQKVGKRDFFEEKISDTRSEIKFTVPGLRKGSVFEYSYEMISENPLDFPDWMFQSNIPVMWSEYNARIPEWFNFLTLTRGFQDYFINEQKKYNGFFVVNGGGRVSFTGDEYRLVMRDLPGIDSEPYMKASLDYLSHIKFNLASVQMPGSLVQTFVKSWTEIIEDYLDDEDFGKRLKSSDEMKADLAEVTADLTDPLEKLNAIYTHVANKMEWNDKLGVWAFESLKDAYKEGTANGTTINLILTQMLRDAGLNAYPVAISTRTHGEILRSLPLNGQFNHTIVYAEAGENYYLLDAKNELRPYNLLPSEDLNGAGLMMKKGEELWVPLENVVPNTTTEILQVTFTPTGYEGQAIYKSTGMNALNHKERLEMDNLNESVLDALFKTKESLSIDTVIIKNDDISESLYYTANFSYDRGDSVSTLYFNPMLTGYMSENPFKLEERTFPVDYNYPFSEKYSVNFFIPEGYEVDEIPQSVMHKLPENGGEFTRIVQQNNNIVSLNYQFRISKSRFDPSEYEYLKAMYDQMVEMLSQNIVLKKV